ncbi:MAG: DNA polymerase IV [Bacteroidetes bacterium GWF2_38_335]|nr:MAG: DNA polymerase IV [Bacteroidetes bacterium GWF2_38_335]OFY81761.1 MAG: DNA polymerase IV [Bacteroidetes bacterium RIFOXYA12_FULL_38_20]HBS87829.1 DNA polymerase IV [Bacteroidales bacterium]
MTENNRNIVHLDLDSFYVSVERLQNSKLMGKPVVIGGLSDRSVVASCSYEARKFGIHSAMPMKMALRLCSDIIVIRGDMDQYSKYSNMVTDIIKEKSPVYEKSSIDEFYVDITGMDRFFGNLKWTRELRQKIMIETGLPISFGLSVNKTVSKMATNEAKPNGELLVPGEHVQPFLNPLSIKKIPMIGDKTFQLLRMMGLTTIRTLTEIPPEMLQNVLGKNGIIIWKKANGIDNTPVKPDWERKSISTEKTFEKDTIDIKMLNAILISMVEKTAFQLRKSQKLTSCVSVKIRYSNFDTHTVQKNITYTNFDHNLIITVKELFEKLYNRRMLIRLIGIRFSNLVYGGQQLNMFEDKPEMVNLYIAMDKIKMMYGSKYLKRAIAMM